MHHLTPRFGSQMTRIITALGLIAGVLVLAAPAAQAIQVTSVSVGAVHACVKTVAGVAKCWGFNASAWSAMAPRSTASAPHDVNGTERRRPGRAGRLGSLVRHHERRHREVLGSQRRRRARRRHAAQEPDTGQGPSVPGTTAPRNRSRSGSTPAVRSRPRQDRLLGLQRQRPARRPARHTRSTPSTSSDCPAASSRSPRAGITPAG